MALCHYANAGDTLPAVFDALNTYLYSPPSLNSAKSSILSHVPPTCHTYRTRHHERNRCIIAASRRHSDKRSPSSFCAVIASGR